MLGGDGTAVPLFTGGETGMRIKSPKDFWAGLMFIALVCFS